MKLRKEISGVFAFITLLVIPPSYSKTTRDPEMSFPGKRISFYTPHLLNPKSFGFEFGYVVSKEIKSLNYPYYAFARAVVAEEFFTVDPKLRASSLGVKAGLILPTQPWIPFFLEFNFGFAKTAYQDDPWFGTNEQTVESKDMFLLEAAAMIRIGKKLLVKGTLQANNVDYFTRDFFLSVGFNY